jgi:putative hydrolase of the HAD superfamily
MIRAVFFDAVGTLLFPTPSATTMYAEVAARHGMTVDADEVRNRLWEKFREEEEIDRKAMWLTSEHREQHRWRNIVQHCLPGSSEVLFQELYQHFAQPHAWSLAPGTGNVLHELKMRGFIVGLASNYDSRLSAVVAGHAELLHLKNSVIISSLVGWRKPAPEFFAAVVQSAECDPSEILFVGDDLENDVAGANAAGMRAVLIDPEGKNTLHSNRITRLDELLQGHLDQTSIQ